MNKVGFYQECIAELYPFSESDLSFFKDVIDFKILSSNKKMKWSYELIEEYKDLWDWKSLDSNKAVFEKVTLGLLFPDKVDLPKCDCYRTEDFCEDSSCPINAKRLIYHSWLYDENVDIYIRLAILCDTGLLNQEMIFELYRNEDAGLIEELIKSSFHNNS